MNKQLENVSELVDDTSHHINEVIDILLSDPDARRLWADSYDMRCAVSEPKAVLASSGFSQNLSEKIDQEPSLLMRADVDIKSARTATVFKFLKPVAGLSVAATVAAVMVFGVGDPLSGNPVSGTTVAANVPVEKVLSSEVIVPVTFTGEYDHRTYWQGSNEATSKELNRYLATHLEHANPGGFQSVMPYVRVVGYDDE